MDDGIRSHEPHTFWQWLKLQTDRHDLVGDVARDAVQDDTFPRRAKTYDRVKTYLTSLHACEGALLGLAKAFHEWQRFQKS